MTPADILQKICDDNNITIKQLSELTGYNLQTLYGITRGRAAKMPQKLSDKIVSLFPQYPLMWLMTGNEAFLNQRGTTTNVSVNMGDSVHNGIVAKNGSHVSSSSVSADTSALTQQIAELQAENKILKEQVSDLTKSILNLTKQQLK